MKKLLKLTSFIFLLSIPSIAGSDPVMNTPYLLRVHVTGVTTNGALVDSPQVEFPGPGNSGEIVNLDRAIHLKGATNANEGDVLVVQAAWIGSYNFEDTRGADRRIQEWQLINFVPITGTGFETFNANHIPYP